MKKIIFCMLLSLVLVSLIFGNVFAKNYNWRCMVPTRGIAAGDILKNLVKEIEEKTGGHLKIELFVPGEHPYKGGDLLRAVSSGEVDMAGIMGGYVSGVEPIFGLVDLPLLIPNGDILVYKKVVEELRNGYLKKVFDKWGLKEVFTYITSGQEFYLKEGWIEDFNSLKGKKIRTWCTEVTDFIKLMNGIPVSIPLGENYTALQTGLLDGTTTSFVPAYNNNIMDTCKNIVMSETSFSGTMYVVNKDVWNELPEDIQKIATEVFERNRELHELDLQIMAALTLQKAFITHDIKAHPIPRDFREELTERAYNAIWKPWIERAGENGQEAFDLVVNILEDMGYKIPKE